MPATQPHVFAASASQDLIDAEFPMWQTGTCVLRDSAGHVCGECWFARGEAGGLELVIVGESGVESRATVDQGDEDDSDEGDADDTMI
jgi:hypothetical protein